MLALGVWLSPLMGGSYRQDGLCHADIPAAYAQIGKTLAEYIPPGSQVYWEARTAVPLLYTSGISIYLPQVYASFSFRINGDPLQLEKYGLWNDELARRWQSQADFIVMEANRDQVYRPGGDFNGAQYQVFQTIPANPCNPASYLLIYKKKP
jgi:hypothetical protein